MPISHAILWRMASGKEEVGKRKRLSGSALSFDDAVAAADKVLDSFQEVSGGMCHDMEKTFFGLVGGESGRVKLSH